MSSKIIRRSGGVGLLHRRAAYRLLGTGAEEARRRIQESHSVRTPGRFVRFGLPFIVLAAAELWAGEVVQRLCEPWVRSVGGGRVSPQARGVCAETSYGIWLASFRSVGDVQPGSASLHAAAAGRDAVPHGSGRRVARGRFAGCATATGSRPR